MVKSEDTLTGSRNDQTPELALLGLKDDEIAEELDRIVVKNYCEKDYMPVDLIEAYTSKQALEAILQQRFDKSSVPHLVSYVLNSPARKIFLLLATCLQLRCLPAMMKFRFNDDDLPISIIPEHGTKGYMRRFGDTEKTKTRFPVPSDWNPLTRRTFERNQWMFLAPVFTEDTFHHELCLDTPLPFLPLKPKPKPKQGGFSTVLEVNVDLAHQLVATTYGQPNSSKVALKDLKVGLEYYEREKKALERIRKIDNPHLVKPIASLRLADRSGYFLFPWAEGGNLWNFWGHESNRDGVIKCGDYEKLLWMLEQIRGLCHALVALHNEKDKASEDRLGVRENAQYGGIGDENGRHGDIKPDNILVFFKGDDPKNKILCIADVGLGKFHAKTTQMRMEGNEITDTKTGTSRYLPPEFDIKTNKQISRLHDVWSLGCVYIEFIVWALWGELGLKQLRSLNFNQFWQEMNNRREVHQDVQKWIQNITKTLSSTEGPTALLDLIQIVESDMLQQKAHRKRSKDILPKLDGIMTKAKSDRKYCFNSIIQAKAKKPINVNPSNLLELPVAIPEYVRNDRTH